MAQPVIEISNGGAAVVEVGEVTGVNEQVPIRYLNVAVATVCVAHDQRVDLSRLCSVSQPRLAVNIVSFLLAISVVKPLC